MYLPVNLEKHWAIDVEGDPIPSTRVWCLVAVNCHTRETVKLTGYDEIKKFIDDKKSGGCKFVGHNIIGYDAPTLNRIIGTRLTIGDLVDTMVLSMVYSPSFSGGHSLANWGSKLNMAKGDFNDFSRYSDEMMRYCLQDTLICREIFIRIVRRMRDLNFTELGLEIEHRAWSLIQTQRKNGFAFNKEEAEVLFATLRAAEEELKEKIYEYWPPLLKEVGRYKRPFKKDGGDSANYARHRQQYQDVRVSEDRQEYACFDLVYFNIGSPQQRIFKLLELGWEPREFTKPSKTHPNGQPKATAKGQLSPSLAEFVEEAGKPEVGLIAEWIEVNARANMINTWLEAYNDKTGCIHGSLWLANTLRYRHSNPNTANIPGVRLDKEDKPLRGQAGKWTYEARDLWVVRNKTRRLVGVDAKGIQLRVLANYLNNAGFTESVLSEDPHEANKKRFGFASRPLTKTITYAILMGAGDNKISNEAKISMEEAKKNKNMFFKLIPEIPKLIRRLRHDVKTTGRITLCDGTPVLVSSEHMVIPYLLQGDESKIMKKAMLIIAQECRRLGLDALQVGMIHDELQFDVAAEAVTAFKQVCLDAFKQAGRFFNYGIEIEGDVKEGGTWSETH